MSLNHNHDHEIIETASSKLKVSLLISVAILVIEVIGGLWANSLALLSDAGHIFTDIIALGLSWYGVRQSLRPADHRMTFGYHRIGVIIAIVNAVTIFIIAGVILYEAYRRFQEPYEIKSVVMLIVAIVGLLVNLLVSFWLMKASKTNINVRSAFLHTLGDALASVGVIAGGILILITGKFWIDPLVSVLISLIILYAAWNILREGAHVILEATPGDVDVLGMIAALKTIPGVQDVHDVHVWSITPDLRAMNGHVLVGDIATSAGASIRQEIEKVMREKYRIGHTTLQLESQKCESSEAFCKLESAHPEEAEGKNTDRR